MTSIDVHLVRWNDPPPLGDLAAEKIDPHVGNRPLRIFVLEKGMTSGAPSVMVTVARDDGRLFLFEMSARTLCAAAATVRALCEQIGFTDLGQP